MKQLFLVPLALLVATALRAQQPAVPARVAQPAAVPTIAPDLTGMVDDWLRGPASGKEAMDRLDLLREWLGGELLREQFADIAIDTTQPVLVRARALVSLGGEHPTSVAAFAYGLDDPEPTVRAAAAIGLKALLANPKEERAAVGELRRALRDPSPDVQGRALEALGDWDAPTLREYLASGPEKPLAAVARQLLELAEARGASLVPRDSTGLLARTEAGVTLEFVPSQRWPQWDIAAGTVRVRRGGEAPVDLAASVEVVRNVIPAVLSDDGRYVAYETAGHVHVRDLRGGQDRDLGPGIAPRGASLIGGFVFARHLMTIPRRDHDELQYGIMFVPWAGGEVRQVGKATATAWQLVNGNASGMRWVRMVETDGTFILTGDGLLAPVPLPDLAAKRG